MLERKGEIRRVYVGFLFSAPLYLNSLFQIYVPSRSLRSASARHFIVHPKDIQNHFHTLLTVPSWWNDLPNSIRAAESLAIFKKQLKTHLFHPLALSSNSILFYTIIFFKKVPLLDLHSIYLLTACFLKKKTNTSFSILFVFNLFLFFSVYYSINKNKKGLLALFLLYSFSSLSVFF